MRDTIENALLDEDMPRAQCPRCGRWEWDYDGFGILAHCTPGYEHGCGYCSHPAIDDGVCGICGLWEESPFAAPGTLLIVTTNIGSPMIVRVDEDDAGKGWMCIWGAFAGRWITPDRKKVGQVLRDGDVIEDDPRRFRVDGEKLVEINHP
ncbi:MAG: hypothetical protein GWN84_05320 [Gammaproteobacteria bacterium]|nr:hypothetical protein [Gammaproteobacteria bacterium]NIR82382.1 hypothetical protein [Gammaproteobacteria bacterium]NIU03527.1 hypothetical protein [Gammaproteobacteria bacterium]NIX84801.1 hypothetical protein [Gammaproteobacteria bacterium]